MKHRVKSGALAIGLLGLAACNDTVGLESSFEDSLTLDVAMFAADAAIDEFGDLGFLFGSRALPAPDAVSTRTVTHTATFFDADGNEQDARDPLTTAWIHLTIESTHEFSRELLVRDGHAFTRHGDLRARGRGDESYRERNRKRQRDSEPAHGRRR